MCFLLWAYLPDDVLKEYGITYYPSRYWALALPAMLCMTILMVVIMYIAINLLSTAPLDSYNTIRGNELIFFDRHIINDRQIYGHSDAGGT